MIIFIVTVQCPVDGRFIDSLWVEQQNAVDRVADLAAEFTRTGRNVNNREKHGSWFVWWSKTRATDGELKSRN